MFGNLSALSTYASYFIPLSHLQFGRHESKLCCDVIRSPLEIVFTAHWCLSS